MSEEISANSIRGFFSVVPDGERRRQDFLSCTETQKIHVDISCRLMSKRSQAVNCRANHSDMEISNKLAQKIVSGEKPQESSHTFLL